MGTIDTIVFDLGAVLIDWDPRHLYRSLFDDEAAMEEFLASICTPAWNVEQDRGRALADATASLVADFPQHRDLIEAYYGRWEEMLGEPIAGTVEIAHELKQRGLRLLALSNWSAETFPRAQHRLGFLDEFDAVFLSGSVGLIKPDPAIYELFVRCHVTDVRRAVFIDDSVANVAAAADAGFDAIQFQSPAQLRAALAARGLLEASAAAAHVD